MRKILLASAALALVASAAAAADVNVPYRKAPEPASYTPVYGWIGPYFALQGGGDVAAIPLSNLSFTSPRESTVFGDPGAFGAGANGFVGGGSVGFNFQLAPMFVVGAEVGAQATGLHSNSNVTAVAGLVSAQSASNLVWDGYADLTLGLLLGRQTRVYALGGLSFGEIKDATSLSVVAANTTLTANDVRTGWNVGVGADYCPDPHFCVGPRYRYVSYGTRTLAATDPTTGVVFAPNRPSAFNEFTLRATVPLY